MAHAANHRNVVAEYGPGHNFLIEGPQVFQRSAAPGHDNHVGTPVLVQPVKGGGNLGRGVQPLHLGGRQKQAGQGIAAADHVLDILPRRAGGGGNYAHDLGELGQGPLARFLEEAFLAQAGFQPFQFLGQGSLAFGQDTVHHEVGGASGFVEAHAPVGADRLAVFQHSGPALAAEQDAVQGCNAVLEGEIRVAR